MDFQIKPIIYILICLLLLWQLLKWIVPFLLNSLVSYMQGIVLDGHVKPDDKKRVLEYLNYPNDLSPKMSLKETSSEYMDFEEID